VLSSLNASRRRLKCCLLRILLLVLHPCDVLHRVRGFRQVRDHRIVTVVHLLLDHGLDELDFFHVHLALRLDALGLELQRNLLKKLLGLLEFAGEAPRFAAGASLGSTRPSWLAKLAESAAAWQALRSRPGLRTHGAGISSAVEARQAGVGLH